MTSALSRGPKQPPTFSLSCLDGNNGFRLIGVRDNDHIGFSLSGAGDVNGDGINDFIIGAPKHKLCMGPCTDGPNPENSPGDSYVVVGRNTSFPACLSVKDLDGSNGFRINGIRVGDSTGYAVSQAGDVNGDGIGDIKGDGYDYSN